MKLKKAACILLAAATAVSAAACGSSSSGGSSSTGSAAAGDVVDASLPSFDQLNIDDYKDLKADIKVLTDRTDVVDTTYKEYAEEFQKDFPNITVTYEGVTDYANAVTLRLTSGDWGDLCFIPDSVDKSELKTYFAPLGKYDDLDKVYYNMNANSDGDTVYGIPNGGNTPGIIINKDVWAKAGITKYPTTPDEFIQDLKTMHFVYSGNFEAKAQLDQFDKVRMSMGISPYHFSWKLERGEQFTAPEVVLTYAEGGLGRMTHNFHDLYRRHLIRSPWLHRDRPVLLNSWEAAYFNFDENKLLKMADAAADCGIEMFVMDDGWFGHRDADDSSLGDWTVDKNKLPQGLGHLSDEIHARGLKFGIWMEPEMMSLDSKLFLQHPDWVIRLKNRSATLSRAQYVLDLSREDVLEYVWKSISTLLKSAKIEYLKWDMNRQLTDLGSYALPAERQGELSHRYVLGVYRLQERLVREFPELLLENCSSGGGRFDPGMLYYSPQIWCSDDTDAVERLKIQEGTQLLYPLSVMGAHICSGSNDMTGRCTPFQTRCDVALAGTFGYELDVSKLSEEEKRQIPAQIGLYKRFGELIREGDYYRITSDMTDSKSHACSSWMVVSKDRSEALFTFVQVLSRVNCKSRIVRLQGLDPSGRYRTEWIHDAPEVPEKGYRNPDVYSGEILMRAGLLIPDFRGDFVSRLIYLHRL